MLYGCMKAFNVVGVRFDLFGQPVLARFGMLKSMPAQTLNLCNLFSWGCGNLVISVIIARSLAYVAKFPCSV